MRTIEIWSDSKGIGPCRGCGARIEWATVVATGKKMPFDAPIVALRTRHDPATRELVEIVDLDQNHWSTCPDAASFKRKARA